MIQAGAAKSASAIANKWPSLSTWVNLLGVGCFLVFVLISVVRALMRRGGSGGLEIHVSRALAASQLPSACVLMYAGFDPSILSGLSGLNIGLTVAGVVLAWVSVKAMVADEPAKTPVATPLPVQSPNTNVP